MHVGLDPRRGLCSAVGEASELELHRLLLGGPRDAARVLAVHKICPAIIHLGTTAHQTSDIKHPGKSLCRVFTQYAFT